MSDEKMKRAIACLGPTWDRIANDVAKRDMQKTLDDLAAIHARIQGLREILPPDSPLGMAAFKIVAMCGEIEAAVRSAPADVSSSPLAPTQKGE